MFCNKGETESAALSLSLVLKVAVVAQLPIYTSATGMHNVQTTKS